MIDYMENKENTQNTLFFKEESNVRNHVMVFHDRLKRHLSAEYLYVTERKDSLERDVMEMKFELDQKDKRLFKSGSQKDTRQYFSPLNLADIDESQKDERMKQLASDVKRLENEINDCENKLVEIKDLLHEIDKIETELQKESTEE